MREMILADSLEDRQAALKVLEASREYCQKRNIAFGAAQLEIRIQNEISGRGAKRRTKSRPPAG